MIERHIDINRFDYDLPDGRIANSRFRSGALRSCSLYRGGEISEAHFADMGDMLPEGQLLVFNNTKVIRARIIMHKPSGGRGSRFSASSPTTRPTTSGRSPSREPANGRASWATSRNGRRATWRSISSMKAVRSTCGHGLQRTAGREHTVRFEWSAAMTFGQLLEYLGRIPIPPYLNRESELIDYTRYQTVYSKFEGSVAAPTAGLHFTPELIEGMKARGFDSRR